MTAISVAGLGARAMASSPSKDIRLALHTSVSYGVRVLPAQGAARTLATPEELGSSSRDIAAFYQVLSRRAGTLDGPAAAGPGENEAAR